MKVSVAAAVIGVFAIIALDAGTASADKCTGVKIKAIGKKESRLLSCSAKEATKGTVGVEPDCDNKAITKFSSSYDKPGPCGDPPSADCELIADDCRDQVRIALPDGDAMTPSVCESKRLKAAGKKASRKLKCYAKAAAKDVPVDNTPGGCLDKASTKFTASFNAVSGCTGDGNAAGIESLIDDECVNELVTVDGMGHVTGICPTVATTTTVVTTTTTTGAATTTTTTGAATTTTTTEAATTTTTTEAATTTTTTEAATTTTTTTTTTSTTTTTAPTCASPNQACHDVCSTGPAECAACTTAEGAGTSGTPGETCVQAVCAQDPTCCDSSGAFTWNSLCISEVNSDCCPSGGTCCL